MIKSCNANSKSMEYAPNYLFISANARLFIEDIESRINFSFCNSCSLTTHLQEVPSQGEHEKGGLASFA